MAFPYAPLGFALIAVGAWRDHYRRSMAAAPVNGLGRLALPPAVQNGQIKNGPVHMIRNIDERVAFIGRWLVEGSQHPQIITAARNIMAAKCGPAGGKYWCVPPKNGEAEIKALFHAVTDPNSPYAIRYTSDHQTVDQFTHPAKMLEVNAEDCDGMVGYLGAMCRAIGIPVIARVVRDRHSPYWSHIYLMADVTKSYMPGGQPSGLWLPLDPTEPERGFRWQLSGANDAARLGRSVGETAEVRDYEITRDGKIAVVKPSFWKSNNVRAPNG